MTPSAVVRALREADVAEWARMRTALWPDQTGEDMRLWRARADAATLVAERRDGGLCGFAEVAERPWSEGADRGPVAYLEGWWVDADVRRTGVGAALVHAAEAWARAQGYRHFCSDIEPGNEASLAAHQALGFSVAGRAILLWKPLT